MKNIELTLQLTEDEVKDLLTLVNKVETTIFFQFWDDPIEKENMSNALRKIKNKLLEI